MLSNDLSASSSGYNFFTAAITAFEKGEIAAIVPNCFREICCSRFPAFIFKGRNLSRGSVYKSMIDRQAGASVFGYQSNQINIPLQVIFSYDAVKVGVECFTGRNLLKLGL